MCSSDLFKFVHDNLTDKLDTITEFEILTMMALQFFADKQPDVVILETGLGGRLDATNVVMPDLTLITDIGLDHEAILGNSIEKIAAEKAGIIKPNTPIITTEQPPEVLSVLSGTAQTNNAPFSTSSPTLLPENARMTGNYQPRNLGLAIKGLDSLREQGKINITDTQIKLGAQKALHWGRFMVLPPADSPIIVDAAHNPMGITALLNSMETHYPNQPFTVLTGMLAIKETQEMIRLLGEKAAAIY